MFDGIQNLKRKYVTLAFSVFSDQSANFHLMLKLANKWSIKLKEISAEFHRDYEENYQIDLFKNTLRNFTWYIHTW